MAKQFYFWHTVSKSPNGNPGLSPITTELLGNELKRPQVFSAFCFDFFHSFKKEFYITTTSFVDLILIH